MVRLKQIEKAAGAEETKESPEKDYGTYWDKKAGAPKRRPHGQNKPWSTSSTTNGNIRMERGFETSKGHSGQIRDSVESVFISGGVLVIGLHVFHEAVLLRDVASCSAGLSNPV